MLAFKLLNLCALCSDDEPALRYQPSAEDGGVDQKMSDVVESSSGAVEGTLDPADAEAANQAEDVAMEDETELVLCRSLDSTDS